MNNSSATCPHCGARLPARGIGGLCADCLIRVSLRSLVRPGKDVAASAGPGPPPRLGDFELLEEIGRGGMGVVWRARQASLNRMVAIKTIRPEVLGDAAAHRRFRFESEMAAMLDHPNIIPVIEVGETAGHAWYAMQLVEGGTLTDHLADGLWSARHCPAHHARRIPWPWRRHCCPRGAALLARLARAVHHAHQRGVLHGDLKPGNVLLDEAGEPHIGDFGLARWLDAIAETDGNGEIVGTPSYMAPEQASRSVAATIATDIYSLGAILYHILTGRPPFLGETPADTLRRAGTEIPAPPRALNREVDPDLEAICLKCLAKDPAMRYASASSLADDLERWDRAEPVHACPATLRQRLRLWTRRRPAVAALSFLAFLLLVAGIAGTAVQARRANHQAQIARRTSEQLWQATPTLVQANRSSPRAGWRREALDALHTAARMRPSTALRNEAAAVLAQAELVSSSSEHRLPTGAQRVCFSRTLEWVAQPLPGPARWRVARLDDDSEVAVFPVPTVAGETPVFSRQSRYLAFRSAASETHPSEVFVWDLSQHSTVLRRPAAGTGECSLAPDESAVVFFGPDGGLHWVRLDDPSQSRIVVADGAGWFLRFAPDGRLAVAGRDRMTIVSPASGMGLQTLSPDFAIAAIAWSPDGCWLAIGGVNHEVRLWSPGEPATRLLGTHDGLVHHVEFSPTSEFLVSNGYDGSSRFWEVPSGRLVAFTQEGYAQQFSADGTRLGWFRSRHSYGAWRFLPSPVYRTFRVPAAGKATIDSADLDAHGRWLIGANDAGVWCFSTTNTAAVVAAPLAGARAARWWPGQPAVLVATTTGLVRLAYREEDTSGTFAWVRTEPLPMDGIEDLTDVWVAADGAQALAISQTKAWLVNLGAADRGPRLLDGALAARGRHARLSPDARWAAVSPDYARGTLLFDVTGGAPNRDFHPAALSRAAFSTDGRWFADGSFDAITLYDTARWQPALRLARESASDLPGVAAFAPDGRSLAYTPNLRSIRLVQLPSGTEVLTLTAPDLRMLTDLFFNEDGRLLGALTSEGTVQLWNLAELHIRLGAMDLDWDEPQSH